MNRSVVTAALVMAYLSHMTPSNAAANALSLSTPYDIDRAIAEIRQKHPQSQPMEVYIRWAKDALISLNLA